MGGASPPSKSINIVTVARHDSPHLVLVFVLPDNGATAASNFPGRFFLRFLDRCKRSRRCHHKHFLTMSFPLTIQPNTGKFQIAVTAGHELTLKEASVDRNSTRVILTIAIDNVVAQTVTLDGKNDPKVTLSVTAPAPKIVGIEVTGGANSGSVTIKGSMVKRGAAAAMPAAAVPAAAMRADAAPAAGNAVPANAPIDPNEVKDIIRRHRSHRHRHRANFKE